MSDVSRYTGSIPPLSTIKDQDTRRALEALVNGWRVRNGELKPDSDEKFITKGELKKLVEDVNRGYFNKGGEGYDLLPSTGNVVEQVRQLLQATTDDILNNQLWVKLGERIPLIDIPSIFLRVDNVETVVRRETQARIDGDSAIVQSVEQLGVRVGDNESGLENEIDLRVNSDNALALAVNTVWAVVGNNAGLVQGGEQISANQVGAVATKWNQVQATIRDPITGQYVGTAAVRDEAKAETDKIKGRLTAERTIKVDANGHVAGIGVIATADMNTGATTSSIIMRADKFAIGGVYPSIAVPFKVYTTSTLAPDGVTVIPPGVYMDTAMIGNATIGTAQIGVASVDTLRVAGNAITANRFASGSGGSVTAGGSTYACAASVTMPSGSSGVVITGMVNVVATSGNATAFILISGSNGFAYSMGFSLVSGYYASCPVQCFDAYPASGVPTTYTMYVQNPNSGPGSMEPLDFAGPSILLAGGKR